MQRFVIIPEELKIGDKCISLWSCLADYETGTVPVKNYLVTYNGERSIINNDGNEITYEENLWNKIKIAKAEIMEVSEHFEIGDTVYYESNDGFKPDGFSVIGVLKDIDIDYNVCVIDDQTLNLAGEGHSSKIFKIVK